MNLLLVSLLALAAVTPLGCSPAYKDSGAESLDRARLTAMEAEIDVMIGTPACSDSTQCRYLPFGAKPCGGPWKYKIYSATSTDTARIRERIEDYNELNAELNKKYGWVSDCSIPTAPVLGCRDGRCVDVR